MQCISNFGVSGQSNPATVATPVAGPQPTQLQPSPTHVLLYKHKLHSEKRVTWSQGDFSGIALTPVLCMFHTFLNAPYAFWMNEALTQRPNLKMILGQVEWKGHG